MLRTKYDLIVGLTTFNHEFLRLSVSGLGRIGKNTLLVIHNDNPCKNLTVRHIRRIGYRGHLHIINAEENRGMLAGRFAILQYIRAKKISAPWFMFANDDDIVLNVSVPYVNDNTYAVMGNAVLLRSCLLDALRVMNNPNDYIIDGADNTLVAPYVGMSGTFVRTLYMLEYAEFMSGIIDEIISAVSDTPFVPPIDLIMWNTFVEYMRAKHALMTPIYMNQTNYLMIKLNKTHRASLNQSDAMIGRVMSVINAALRGNE